MQEVAQNLYAVTDEALPVNAYFLVTTDGVVVIDSLTGPAKGQEILDAVKSVTSQPVRYLINTHEHWDHICGNEIFAALPGCLIIGHHEVRADIVRGPAIHSPENQQRLQGVHLTPPHLTFSARVHLHLGDERIIVEWAGGHSPASAFVWLPGQQLLCAGDMLTGRYPPFMATSSLRTWLNALGRISGLRPQTIFPGHGPPQPPESVQRLQEWLGDLRRQAEGWIRAGMDPADVVERVMAAKELPERQRAGLHHAYPIWKADMES